MGVHMKNTMLIITGMSGAGKSRAAHTLEDLGYFCIDNLPPALFGKFIDGMQLSNSELPKTAIVADIRSGPEAMPELEKTISGLHKSGMDFRLIYLEASDEVIVRRYKENRRPHPLAKSGQSSLISCIREERRMLSGLRGAADFIIDTTGLTDRQLAEQFSKLFGGGSESELTLSIISFGFKYGLPIDADMVIDVRFLPNPYYIPELKAKSGLEHAVYDFVMNNAVTQEFMRHYLRLLLFLLPHYRAEGKKHFVIAIGCTGGYHRSVAIAAALGKQLGKACYTVTLNHRDLDHARLKG